MLATCLRSTCAQKYMLLAIQSAQLSHILNSDRKLYRILQIRGADKFLARPGRKQVNVSVRMAWFSFSALPCRGKKNLMTASLSMSLKSLASLHASELVSFLVGLGSSQNLGTKHFENMDTRPYGFYETICIRMGLKVRRRNDTKRN